jgi:hypothetical protein
MSKRRQASAARRAALVQTVKNPEPLDRVPLNREQRRLAARALQRDAKKRASRGSGSQ